MKPLVTPGTVGWFALAHVWEGHDVTIISSPPGAGKTETITTIVPHLSADAGLKVVVACPTIAGAYDIATRIAKHVKVVLSGSSFTSKRAQTIPVDPHAHPAPGLVLVKTVAGMKFYREPVDVLVVDEAYQVSAFDLRQAAACCCQLLLVGDPGQIGPVITIDTSVWDTSAVSPAKPAPNVFRLWPGAKEYHLPSSFRLGAESVNVVREFYDFPFTSTRPISHIEGVKEIQAITVPHATSPTDMTILQTAIDHAHSLLGRQYVRDSVTRFITGKDICVLASRNEQVSILEAMCASNSEMRDVAVGTADSRQGGQWPAVVVVDPFAGVAEASGHAANLGRLCVMLSRHMAHCVMVTSENVAETIDRSGLTKGERETHQRVRAMIHALT